MRVQMINAKALVTIGELLEISKYLLLGKSERETGGEKKASNIADAVEAIIGAAYLDGKLNAARKIFEKVFVPNINLIPEDHFVDNFKGLLQTKVQKKLHVNPQYHLLETHGPPHAMEFVVEVRINEKVFGKGKGKTKREAEQQAAKEALAKFT